MRTSDFADLDGLLARARAAQRRWAMLPVAERVAVVERFRNLVAERSVALAAVVTDETRKPITQAVAELEGVLPRVEFFCDRVEAVVADEVVYSEPGLTERIDHDPLGVVVNVSAWNYPWFVGVNVLVPALLTGNAVLYKPSELASATGASIVGLLHEAGVPEDLVVCVPGGGEVGAALVRMPVDGVFFTGSHATGVRIAEAVAGRLVPLQLELGGKDPVYVTDDVDLAAAAEAVADGAFYNSGQSCCSVERLYVHASVHDAFVDAFVRVVEGFVVGSPHDPSTYIGPLTRAAQADVLERQVADAVASGATVVTGGSRLSEPPGESYPPGEGVWFQPTVLTGVTTDMAVMREESFGPILGIQAVADDDEAVARMDDTDFGLTAGVYTRDRRRAEAILAQLETGSSYWNCCDRVSPRLPWSGRRASGVGTTLSTIGIRAFTRPRAWHLRSPS